MRYTTGTINTGNDERSDLPLFHESPGSGGQVDGARVGVHDLAGSALESVRAVAFEQTTRSPSEIMPIHSE